MKTAKNVIYLAVMFIFIDSTFASNKIGVFCEGEPKGDVAGLIEWSRTHGYVVDVIHPWPNGQFKKEGIDLWINLSDYKLLWLDVSNDIAADKDAGPLSNVWTDTACKKAILSYLCSGGTLVVSTLAMRYPVDLGLETVLPNDWGQYDGDATIGYKFTVRSGFCSKPGTVLQTGQGSRLFRWMRYGNDISPANGKILAVNYSNDMYKELISWKVGKGEIYGIAALPWLTDDNAKQNFAGDFATLVYKQATISPDAEIAKQMAEKIAAEKRSKELQALSNLKISDIARTATVGEKMIKKPYTEMTEKGFVVGNEFIERRIEFLPTLRTVSIWNKLSNEAIPVGSAEFRLTFGKEGQELNLGSADFAMAGKIRVCSEQDATITVTMERKEFPALKVVIIYSAGNDPQISKNIRITNLEKTDLFLREVWLDTLRFNDDANVIPYTVFTAFARTQVGCLWLCQNLPYSVPSVSSSQKWIGIAYPPCDILPAGDTYDSEKSYLTAVKLSGVLNTPNKTLYPDIVHQITPYGPFGDPIIPLDEAEIESCLDFVDRHGTQIFQPEIIHYSYHDYGMLGPTDFLPYVKGAGGGFENIKKWLDRSISYGLRHYCVYPDFGAWMNVSEANEMLTDQILPYLNDKQMNLTAWFSVYTSSWYSGVGLKNGKVLSTYRDKEIQNWLVSRITEMIERYRLSGINPDQAAIQIDSIYDKSFGYPGSLPLSPSIYDEYKAWDFILKRIRQKSPDFYWGTGHFGNNQSPLFCGINSYLYWCEGVQGPQHYGALQNRHCATSPVKAFTDTYRREMFWYHKERFVPYRFMTGNIFYQISTGAFEKPIGEPIYQQFRYLTLQDLATCTNAAVWGLDAMIESGLYKDREKNFFKKWMLFLEQHVKSLSSRPYIPSGEPRYGMVEVYSHGDRGNGFVFLVNPNLLKTSARFKLDKKTGFNAEETYAVRELSPYERWCLIDGQPTAKPGKDIEIEVPGFTVAVLQIRPVKRAWGDQSQITAGVEVAADNRILVEPGQDMESIVFDVKMADNPKQLNAVRGSITGTSPRIEITDWFVKAGDGQIPPSDNTDAKLVRFAISPDIANGFALNNFAGLVIWDMDKDPVADRVAIDSTQLIADESLSQNPSNINEFVDDKDANGYWLSAVTEMDSVPRECVIIMQIALPESVNIKLWINDIQQDCQRTFNDWAVLKPNGLKAGKNRLDIHMNKKN